MSSIGNEGEKYTEEVDPECEKKIYSDLNINLRLHEMRKIGV